MTARQTAQWVIQPTAPSGVSLVSVRCEGSWTVKEIPHIEQQLPGIPASAAGDVIIDASGLTALDTAGAWLLHRTLLRIGQQGRKARIEDMRPEHKTLLELVATHAGERQLQQHHVDSQLVQVGKRAVTQWLNIQDMLAFIGESAVASLRVISQPRRIRWRTVLHNLQSAGFEALPITGLLSFLMGVVIAYQGADQLQRFGANIFIADLVGLAMLRELSPLLTAIIVAGRSGSAYAAQIGTMKVTEEIDALRTIGVGPQELLVLPKILALMIALPLLTVYADVAGIFGGMLMARSKLDVSFDAFLDRLGDAISLSSFLVGVAKAPVFAAIIALVGCFQGFQASGSADSVGRQTTVSVVQSIFLVIVVDAMFSILFNWLKI
ncbi:MAG: MlaE family lipid ABC transporter permease subunit [Gammaproteobacteria bacterium]|nr:MlaE family lipid ABC transporter permease subunit [Gammaproteobacteria bacterium]